MKTEKKNLYFFSTFQQAGIHDPARVRADHVGFGVVLGEDKKKFKVIVNFIFCSVFFTLLFCFQIYKRHGLEIQFDWWIS